MPKLTNEFDLAKFRKILRQKDKPISEKVIDYFLDNLKSINGAEGSQIKAKDWRKFSKRLLQSLPNLLEKTENWSKVVKVLQCKHLLTNWQDQESATTATILSKNAKSKNQKQRIINLFQSVQKEHCLPSQLKNFIREQEHDKFQKMIHETFKDYQNHRQRKNNSENELTKILVKWLTQDCLQRIIQNNNEKKNEFYYLLEEYTENQECFVISKNKVIDRRQLPKEQDFKNQTELLKSILSRNPEDVGEIVCELIAYLEKSIEQKTKVLNEAVLVNRAFHEYGKLTTLQKKAVWKYITDIKEIMKKPDNLHGPKVKKLKSSSMYRYKPTNRVDSSWFRIIFKKNNVKEPITIIIILKRDENTYKRLNK